MVGTLRNALHPQPSHRSIRLPVPTLGHVVQWMCRSSAQLAGSNRNGTLDVALVHRPAAEDHGDRTRRHCRPTLRTTCRCSILAVYSNCSSSSTRVTRPRWSSALPAFRRTGSSLHQVDHAHRLEAVGVGVVQRLVEQLRQLAYNRFDVRSGPWRFVRHEVRVSARHVRDGAGEGSERVERVP
jgi:hypothetical protein